MPKLVEQGREKGHQKKKPQELQSFHGPRPVSSRPAALISSVPIIGIFLYLGQAAVRTIATSFLFDNPLSYQATDPETSL
jgi:hypothetical protein